MTMTRTAARARALLLIGACAGTLLGWSALPATAATTQTASCVDGGGTRWDVRVAWGAAYRATDGRTRVALTSAGWTTSAGPVRTDSQVRTYDGTGTRLQDLRWSGTFDYASGTASKARNPVNPPSAPGKARVKVTLGVDGDGHGSCSVTLYQPGASAPTSPTDADRYGTDVLTATNRERADAGQPALTVQACLDGYAQAQATRMASETRMFHQELSPVLDACRLSRVGENVAYGYPDGTAVTAAWMASPGHRANILESRYRLIGIGAAQDAQGRWYAAQVFGTAS